MQTSRTPTTKWYNVGFRTSCGTFWHLKISTIDIHKTGYDDAGLTYLNGQHMSTSSLRSKIWISIRFNLEQPVTSFWQQVSQKNWSAWPLKSTSIKVCQLWAGLRIIQCLSFGFLCVCVVSYFLSTVYPNILQYWYALVVVCFMCSKKTYNRSCTQTNYISISSPSSSRFLWFIYPRDNQCRGWWANKRFHRELVVKLLSLGGGSQARMKVSACTVSSVVFEQRAKGCLRPWPLKVRGTYKTKRAKLVSI